MKPGAALPHQRCRAGVAAVVLPLEQHPGRRAARCRRARGQLRDPAVLEQQVRRMLADPRADVARRQLRRPVAVPAQSRRARAGRAGCSRLRRQPAAGVPRETELFFESIIRERPQRARPADGRLHVPQRAPGQALRHPGRLRHAVPARDAAGRQRARRAARTGQHSDRDVVRQPDVAGAARQVGAREHPRHAAAAAAAECAAAEGSQKRAITCRTMRERMARAPRESGLRGVPHADGSARVGAGELRRDRPLARHAARTAARSTRRAACRTAPRSRASPDCSRRCSRGPIASSARGHRKAADLSRSAAASSTTTRRPFATIVRDCRARDEYRFVDAVDACERSSKSTPFQMRRKR